MFSVTYTGMNLLPLCTANVCPTKSGITVLARDHVFTTRFSFRLFIAATRFSRLSWMYGPFFKLLAISKPSWVFPKGDARVASRTTTAGEACLAPTFYCVALPRFRPRTMSRCEDFLVLRVLTPSFLPHGLTTDRKSVV